MGINFQTELFLTPCNINDTIVNLGHKNRNAD